MLLGSDESNVVNLAEIRGWTFQGYLLSPRTLDFGTYQTTYKCLKFGLRASGHQSQDYGICEEKLGSFRSRFYDLHARGDLEHGMRASQNWKTAVELFTRTDLSVPHNRLLAISGIALVQGRYERSTYLAGLWRARLSIQLRWELLDPRD